MPILMRSTGAAVLWLVLGVVVTQTAIAQPPSDSLADEAPPDTQTSTKPDVIIVGAGISGLAAALEAARGGLQVEVIDMWSIFGGHAVMSSGGLSISGSDYQREQGVIDTPELHAEDFFEWGEDPDPYWVDYYTRNSKTEIGEWLNALGVEWEGLSQPPGNSVPRFHLTNGRGLGLVMPIYREVLRYPNVTFRWNFKVTELVIERGRVLGVRGEDLRTGTVDEIRADRVLLATGGFQSNLEMVRRFWLEGLAEPSDLLVGSGVNSVGSGLELAEQAGAEFHRMDHQWNYPWGLPHPRYPGEGRALSANNQSSIWVNAQGVRFVNELQSSRYLFPAVVEQEPSTYWAIFDEDQKTTFFVSGSGWDDPARIQTEILENSRLTKSATSLTSLAEAIGIDAEALTATVQRFNELLDRGVDEDFGRFDAEDGLPVTAKLEKPPFYAIQFFPMTRKSMGGVMVDENTRVVSEDGSVVPGLYASGELTGFAGVNGSAGLEGTFLGPALLTGRVAGQTLLAEVANERVVVAPEPRSVPTLGHQEFSAADTASCELCHALPQLTAEPREGYAHFERVHRLVLEANNDCGMCHTEMIPYNPLSHEIDRVRQTENCVHCHRADEQP